MAHSDKKSGGLFSKLRRQTAFKAVQLADRISGHKVEPYLHGRLLRRMVNTTDKLVPLAWKAEHAENLELAICMWLRVVELSEDQKSERKVYHKALGKIAGIEIKLRRQIDAFSGPDDPQILPSLLDINPLEMFQGIERPKASNLKKDRKFLTNLWQKRIGELSSASQNALHNTYCDLASIRIRNGSHYGVVRALQPVLFQRPDHQKAYRLYYKSTLSQFHASKQNSAVFLRGWWDYYTAHQEDVSPATWEIIWAESEKMARKLLAEERFQDAVDVISPAFLAGPDKSEALVILAKAAESRQDWENAANYWQLYASITNPVTTKSRTHVAENPEEMLRKSNYGLNQLRMARLNRAVDIRGMGQLRQFNELVSRIIETIPDQRVFKNNPQIVDLVKTYVQDALKADGVSFTSNRPEGDKPLKIAICLDILKISAVHTHARVVFAICRNLMELDERIETHVIITNERFAVTTPVVSASFNPNRDEQMQEAAQQAMPEYYGKRFFLHGMKSIGLEGLIDTCKNILQIAPDVMLYGGGHKGLFSNESRVVRHCLYDHLPTAFFYIQANNEVDDKIDMIISRGPHDIIGERGNALVRAQPYPTIVANSFVTEVPIEFEKMESKIIVSAITGVRMDVLINKMSRLDMENMFSILDEVPGTVWHLFGSTDPKALIKSNPMIEHRVNAGQMVVHPVVPFDEFTDFVSKASLFFHMPGITGGSGGATVARRAGIPIVTFKHSDVSGRQPAQTIFDERNVAACADFATRLLTDRELWAATIKAQFDHTEWIRDTAPSGFYDCLTETVTAKFQRGKNDPVMLLRPTPEPAQALSQDPDLTEGERPTSLPVDSDVQHGRPYLSVVKNEA